MEKAPPSLYHYVRHFKITGRAAVNINTYILSKLSSDLLCIYNNYGSYGFVYYLFFSATINILNVSGLGLML